MVSLCCLQLFFRLDFIQLDQLVQIVSLPTFVRKLEKLLKMTRTDGFILRSGRQLGRSATVAPPPATRKAKPLLPRSQSVGVIMTRSRSKKTKTLPRPTQDVTAPAPAPKDENHPETGPKVSTHTPHAPAVKTTSAPPLFVSAEEPTAVIEAIESTSNFSSFPESSMETPQETPIGSQPAFTPAADPEGSIEASPPSPPTNSPSSTPAQALQVVQVKETTGESGVEAAPIPDIGGDAGPTGSGTIPNVNGPPETPLPEVEKVSSSRSLLARKPAGFDERLTRLANRSGTERFLVSPDNSPPPESAVSDGPTPSPAPSIADAIIAAMKGPNARTGVTKHVSFRIDPRPGCVPGVPTYTPSPLSSFTIPSQSTAGPSSAAPKRSASQALKPAQKANVTETAPPPKKRRPRLTAAEKPKWSELEMDAVEGLLKLSRSGKAPTLQVDQATQTTSNSTSETTDHLKDHAVEATEGYPHKVSASHRAREEELTRSRLAASPDNPLTNSRPSPLYLLAFAPRLDQYIPIRLAGVGWR